MARIDQVLDALKQATEATAKQLARTLDRPTHQVSQLLGKLYWQGLVTRERLPNDKTREFVYRVKIEAPPIVAALPFPARMAERETERV